MFFSDDHHQFNLRAACLQKFNRSFGFGVTAFSAIKIVRRRVGAVHADLKFAEKARECLNVARVNQSRVRHQSALYPKFFCVFGDGHCQRRSQRFSAREINLDFGFHAGNFIEQSFIIRKKKARAVLRRAFYLCNRYSANCNARLCSSRHRAEGTACNRQALSAL